MDVLMNLEPRFVKKDMELIRELEEYTEVYFFNRGTYDIGFKINYKDYFVLRYKNSNVIGAYGVTFNVRAQFLYKTCIDCEGFTIRK